MPWSVAVLEPDTTALEDLTAALREAGCEVECCHDAACLHGLVDDDRVDLAIVDQDLGDGVRSGTDIIAAVHRADPDLPLVAVAATADVDKVQAATQAGAIDFLVRGGQMAQRVDTLLRKTRKVMALIQRNRYLRSKLGDLDGTDGLLIGESAAIADLRAKIKRLAGIPRPVLIVGERGTGKELVARAIHHASRSEGEIVTLNCAAFSDNLLETELFGHEKGAFTGADRRVIGKFELAHGGTLFLDEVGNMPLPFQQKILRVVEYGIFNRVGGATEIRTTARIIAATNADLQERIKAKEFLADLYDRLAFVILEVPPLRERPDDIELLAHYFLREFGSEIPALAGKTLADSSVTALRSYAFPGNVRELKNIIERAAYRDETDDITPSDIGLDLLQDGTGGQGFADRVTAYQKRIIAEALRRHDGNQAGAARELELAYHQVRYYVKKFGL